MIGQQVKLFEPEKFNNVILRPGAMHIIMSLLGCIGTLMKCSGLEVVVAAAFGGLTGIINGKALVRPMQAYQIVSTALLARYLHDDVNTCDKISD